MEVLEELRVVYAVRIAKNSTLEGLSAELMRCARADAEEQEETVTMFGEAAYRSRSWRTERSIIFRGEVLLYPGRTLKDNDRYVVTNRAKMRADNLYDWYCGRGNSENHIKELTHDLSIDRTSCTASVANQFRVLMTAAAFVLVQELRWRLRGTRAARATTEKLRDMLLTIATRVVTSRRRIVCHFPRHMPWADVWQIAARECGPKLAWQGGGLQGSGDWRAAICIHRPQPADLGTRASCGDESAPWNKLETAREDLLSGVTDRRGNVFDPIRSSQRRGLRAMKSGPLSERG